MSNSENNTLNALESLQTRKVYVEDLFTTQKRCNSDPVENVYRTIAIPIFLNGDEDSPYEFGATSFDKFKQTIKPNPIQFFFQFMLLFVENIKNYGGLCSMLKYNSSLYPKLVHLLAVRATGQRQLNEQENRWLNQYTQKSEYEDLQLVHDVTYEAEYVRWVQSVLSKRKRTKKKKEGEEEQHVTLLSEHQFFKHARSESNDNELRNDLQEDDEVTSPAFGDENGNELEYKDWIMGEFPSLIDMPKAVSYGEGFDDEALEIEMDKTVRLPEPKRRRPQPQVDPEQPEKRQRRSNSLNHSDMHDDQGKAFKAYTPLEENIPQRVSKALFTWSVIQDEFGVPAIAIAQVIVKSNQVNVGMFQTHLIKNNEDRLFRLNSNHSGPRGMTWVEMFPNYQHDFYRGNHPAGNTVNKQTFVNCIREYVPELFQRVASNDVMRFYESMDMISDGETHLYRVLSLENAITYCVKKITEKKYRINLGSLNTVLWFNSKTRTCTFPVPTWKPAWIATFWRHPTFVGLNQKYFFHVDMKTDFLKNLCGGNDMSINSVEKLLSETPLISIGKVMDNKLLNYETSNQMIHAAAERDVIYGRIKQHFKSHFYDTHKEVRALIDKHGKEYWRGFASPDLKNRVTQVETYNQILNTTQDALLGKFRALWPLAGSVDDLNISDTLKVMAKWYQDNKAKGKLPHMTREFRIWDPELDFFGNGQIQHLSLYVYFQRVLQPLICLMSEGLFSAYDAKMDEMSFRQIIHGRYDTGKTFTGIKTLIDFTCIPGTVAEFSLSTKAADTTRKHCYDEIIASDECPNWLISEKEAEKFPEQVNKEKIKATRGQLCQRTFAFITLPNGEKIRWNEDVVTDHKTAYVYVTNQAAESKRALSSRMHRVTMKQCKTPANEMVGHMDATLKADAKMWNHINQYLSCCLKKSMAIGYNYPEVNMDLFDKVANLALHYMRDWGCIEDNGSRPLDIVRPYHRQCVVKHAIRMVFDLPSSPHYKKPFDLSMMKDCGPYMYTTVSQIWWALTSCVSEYIEDDNSNVIRAMMKVAGIDWQEGDSCYGLFERDVKKAIRYKVTLNPAYNDDMPIGDKYLIDLNYVCLEGDEDTLANQIAFHTHPRLDGNSVKAILRQLKDHMLKPENGGYIPQPQQTLETWHKYTVLPTATNRKGVKRLGFDCPPQYNVQGDADKVFRSVNDIPCHKGLSETRQPVVDMSQLKGGSGTSKLYFIPSAVNMFQQNMIRAAMQASINCGKTRPCKFLEGMPDNNDPTMLSCFTQEQEDIDNFNAVYDSENGYGVCPKTGNWVYMPGKKVRGPIPISRKNDGIAFNMQAALGKKDAKVVTAQPMAPKPEGSTWKADYVDGSKSMSKTREVIDDLDYYSALQQHIICGRPLDEPVRDPVWIKQQYDNKVPATENLNMDYPHDWIKEKTKMSSIWESSFRDVRNKKKKDKDSSKQTLLKVFTRTLTTTSSMSRKEREELKRSRTVDMGDEEEEREDDLNVGGVDVTRSSTLMTAPSVVYGTPKRSKSKKKKNSKKNPGPGLGRAEDPQLLSGLGGDQELRPSGAASPGLVVAPLEFPMGRGFNAPPRASDLARQRLEKSKKTK